MKITDVIVNRYMDMERPDMAHADGHEIIVVDVHTDEGIQGTGFVTWPLFSHGFTGDVAAALLRRNLKNVILGENPLFTERIWQKMYKAAWKLGTRGIFRKCMAAIDFALWDIKGKRFQVPVSHLFGEQRERVLTYANVGHHLPPDQLAEKAAEYVQKGHKAIKIRGGLSAVSLKEASRRVQAVREAIGPDVKLMVDINGSWDADTAIEKLKEWEPYDIYWLEEPVPPEDLTGYVRVRARAGNTYIAGGEQNEGLNEFRQLIVQGGIDIAQPNASATGGITDWLRIYHFATAYDIPVAPWNLQQVHIHMAVGLINVKWVEYFTQDRNFFQNRLFKGPLLREVQTEEGICFLPPDGPGLGLELDEAEAERALIKE